MKYYHKQPCDCDICNNQKIIAKNELEIKRYLYFALIFIAVMFIVLVLISTYKIELTKMQRDYYKEQMLNLCWANDKYQDILEYTLNGTEYFRINCEELIVEK